jgi:hypothetical protein
MASGGWKHTTASITALHLDPKNPRLGENSRTASPQELIQTLFLHDKVMDVAQSIAVRGFFPNEPLLVVREDNELVVVEGNRRLAALKALREPSLLEGSLNRQLGRLARRFDADSIKKIPIVIAPDRRATDKQVAGKHVGTPVLPWQAENRAAFILEKLDEGYEPEELFEELGFTSADIQDARQTRAIVEICRTLEFPPDISAKLDNPRSKIFSTVGRIFESTVGRSYLHVEPSADFGFRGATSAEEFSKGLRKLVVDIASGTQSSRTLNTNEDIKNYFESWGQSELPKKKRGASFVPADITGHPNARADEVKPKTRSEAKQASIYTTALPKSFKVSVNDERLIDIRRELVRLKRKEFPNAGSVLLRVFFELSATQYLQRTGELSRITDELKQRGKLQFGSPTMRQLVPELIKVAKAKLKAAEATKVEKALKYDAAAPFTVSDLHAFVHQNKELPGERDILQFWLRTEPLFKVMVESAE